MYKDEVATFLKVADCGSFSKAARELYMSTVSVMKQVNQLEAYVGAPLVKRTNRGVLLTAAGHSFCEDARRMVALSDAAVRRAQTVASAQKYVIRIGTSILRSCDSLISFWDSISDVDSEYVLRIVPFDDQPADINSILSPGSKEQKKADLFVGCNDAVTWRQKYNFLELCTVSLKIAVSKKHPLARKEALNWEMLNGETVMMVKPGVSWSVDILRQEILTNHPDIHLIDAPHIYDINVLNDCAQMNYLLEIPEIWSHVHPNLKSLPMEWEYRMPYGIIYSKSVSPAVQSFLDIIEQNKDLFHLYTDKT